MKKTTLFIISSIFSSNIFSLGSFVADYKLVIDGIKVAVETRNLKEYEGKYEYVANAKTTGVAKLFGEISIEAKSIFSINSFGINSERYTINETKDNKLTRSYILKMSSLDNKILSLTTPTNTKAKTFKADEGNILDPLSLFIALSHELENKPNKIVFNYQVADGKYLKNNSYKKASNEIVMIGGKEVDVIKIEELNSDKNLTALFSPKHLYLPVIIEQTKQGRVQRYELTGLKAKPKCVDLQVIL